MDPDLETKVEVVNVVKVVNVVSPEMSHTCNYSELTAQTFQTGTL